MVFAGFLLSYCGGGGGTPTYNISGAVTLNSAGLADVTMTLSGASSAAVASDSGGNYTFRGLANGSYTITPGLSGYTFSPTSSAQVLKGANITGVNFTAASSALLVQLVACPGSGTTNDTIQDYFFNPSDIIVSANTILRWTNNGPSMHTVTSTTVAANGSFDSSSIPSGSSVCFKFATAGAYNYHCTLHPTLIDGSRDSAINYLRAGGDGLFC